MGASSRGTDSGADGSTGSGRAGSAAEHVGSAPTDDDGPAVGFTGARFGGRQRGPARWRATEPDPGPARPGEHHAFASARHGYDRSEVDERIAAMRAELADAERSRRAATALLDEERHRADRAEQELREARAAQADRAEGGFGVRAERILRLAEAEAREVRTSAAADAAVLLERAQAEAEARRHEVEKELIARVAAVDAEAAERSSAVSAREQQVAAELESARREGEELRAAAARDAEQLRAEARAAARAVREQAEEVAARDRAAAVAEVDRLGTVHRSIRDEFARLRGIIAAELSKGPSGRTTSS